MSHEAHTHFGLSLLKKSDVDESVVISPLSIAIALAMVHAGAEDATEDEIRNVIGKDSTDEELQDYYKFVGRALHRNSEVVVKLANRIFVRDDFKVKETYLNLISKNFKAKAVNLDFGDKEGACKEMNDFVEDVTDGKIKDLVQPTDIGGDTLVILINAIYFAGKWMHPFNGESRILEFHVKNGVTKEVPFMSHSRVSRDYTETEDLQMLSLGYKDRDFKFIIVLPKERFGLAAIRDELSVEALLELLDRAHNHLLDVTIPKFKIEKEMALRDVLQNLGIKKMFTDYADLNGISKSVTVSDVKHKALIEVDESGTKAAAATVVKMAPRAAAPIKQKPIKVIKFRADHPFLFFIFHKENMVFCGQYNA